MTMDKDSPDKSRRMVIGGMAGDLLAGAMAPGPFWTPLQVTGGQPAKKLPAFGKETPMGRPGQPVELAGVYVLLASNESNFATGQVFGETGGHGGP